MKKNKTEYIVVNSFSEISEAERKEKINNSIRTLCVMDIEKLYELDYNKKVEEIDSSAWIFTEYSYPAMVADGNNIYITYTYKRDKIKYVFVSFNEEA